MLERLIAAFERLLFGHRAAVLGVLALVTAVAAVFASRLHMTAGFGKQLPLGHEYTETFVKYKDVLFGANRLIVVVHAKQGDIWKPETLKKLNEVTQALMYLPGVDRRSVSSLWTPNTRVMQVTEEGYEARDVIGGDITPEKLDAAAVARIRDNVVQGGYVGSLVADFHRNLLEGGVYYYPGDKKNPNGKLRLVYEANPLGFIAQAAGGYASNGTGPILDMQPDQLHQRVPLFIGDKALVLKAEEFARK